jgi:hypothetical protein
MLVHVGDVMCTVAGSAARVPTRAAVTVNGARMLRLQQPFLVHVSTCPARGCAKADRCCLPVDMQDVQGLAIDAARSNVERHYVYIQEACADFMRRYRGQVLSCS